MFIAALYTIAKIWKQPKCPSVDEWIKKIENICVYICIYVYVYIHTHTMEYYSAIKNEILPFETTWMDLETIILSKISQSEKDRYYVLSLIYGI